MTNIAVIGLGHMGGPMAANLVLAGHEVTGFDLVPAALEAAHARGVRAAVSAQEAVIGAEVVLTVLQTGSSVLALYAAGILEAAPPNSLFIESSTISVEDAQAAHALVLAAGHRGIDAPVSGGVVGAEAATLAFMVGGSDEDFAAALPVLEAMGQRIVHCGGSGLGQAAKVCNNLILGASMIAVSEAFVLGEQLGLSHEALFDVASNASGQCWSLTANCPVPGPVPGSPANHHYAPGFSTALMAKDLGLAEAALDHVGVDAQVGRLASALYRAFTDGSGDGLDFSAIILDVRARSEERGAAPGDN
ncbi:3-hydroxyisobutyrate dehydrogenase [Leucobacter salsicius]|uniref:3-hydroxyisobutyrate dehydrogenase n=1 Tax=Leucobacter salsicius TaxID=664638 RepID=UPI000348B97A|nr:3-hydroxyisobutyrate dehydrogenase [Leucobacter salsicius]